MTGIGAVQSIGSTVGKSIFAYAGLRKSRLAANLRGVRKVDDVPQLGSPLHGSLSLLCFVPVKKSIFRLASTILILAALYLIPVDLALNLPATRNYLNNIQSDRLAVTRERAWSLYPLRFELTGLAADGQTPTEQWQVDAQSAAVSVSPLPLLKGEIRLYDLDLANIDLRLRPRPTPKDDHRELAKYFPVIRNRDPDAVAESVPDDEGGALELEIDDIHVKGEHAFWLSLGLWWTTPPAQRCISMARRCGSTMRRSFVQAGPVRRSANTVPSPGRRISRSPRAS